MFVIGLTGGIGSGKSTLASLFAKLGARVISADTITQNLLCPHSKYQYQIIQHFGESVSDSQGNLDKRKLRGIIFSDAKAKAWLETFLHPIICEHMKQQLKNNHPSYTILEIPLLIEVKPPLPIDRVLVIEAPESLRIQRTQIRDNEMRAEIKRIIQAQSSSKQRLLAADDVIRNDSSVSNLRKRAIQLHQKYRVLSQAKESL